MTTGGSLAWWSGESGHEVSILIEAFGRYRGALPRSVLQQPHTTDALRKNPLGLYVNGRNWSRELNHGESP